CNSLIKASAANDILCIQEIDEAVIQIVKDCGRKLRDSLPLRPPGPHLLGMLAVMPGPLIVLPILRPQSTPAQLDTAMPGPVVPDLPGPVIPDPDIHAIQEPAIPGPDEPAVEEPTITRSEEH